MGENKLLGKGRHGNVYSLKNFTLLQNLNILSINLYSLNPEHDITIYPKQNLYTDIYIDIDIENQEDEINDFLNILNEQHDKIVKIFTDKGIVIEDFKNELKSNRKLNSIYGEKSSKYITLSPILKFKNVELMGCVININDNKRDSLHLLFGTMCKNDHKINKTDKLNKFMIHILKSLIILQKRGYSHNDIREDNTVSSNNFYKLIDWGRLRKVDDMGKENVFGLEYHPLFMYLHKMKIPKNCKNLIDLVTIKHKQKKPWIIELIQKCNFFNKTISKIESEFFQIINNNPNKKFILNKYKYTFDIFRLGTIMINIIYKNKLDYNKYKDIINKFTSLTNPPKNAKDALHFFIRNTKK